MFQKSLLNTKLEERTFSPKSKIDTSKHYSKKIFANSIVKKNASTIDFSGFDPLLARLVKVLEHFEEQKR